LDRARHWKVNQDQRGREIANGKNRKPATDARKRGQSSST
jgi:hypothetical protein